jgi:2-phosphosulfolactate phosphatase
MRVVIDCFFEEMTKYRNDYTIVAVDVIRASTTAITGVSLGRKCYPVASIEEATSLAQSLENPLMVGELGGNMPYDFHLQNSPMELESQTELHRPMILLTTSGTPLICSFKDSADTYIACLRNYRSMTSHLIDRHSNIALIGAGSRGEFRVEDQLCCAWIAQGLIQHGYKPENKGTMNIVERWREAPASSILEGKSAIYLAKSGQTEDLDYIVSHVDDLNSIYYLEDGQIVERRLPAGLRQVI